MEGEVCPACGKPTGGYTPCPHCGADPRIRLGLKGVALLCLVLLGIGIGYFLLHTATLRANPVPIASIDSWLNYASIWVEGTVISGPRVDERSVSFEIQDATEESLEVNVYVAPGILDNEDGIPMVGDRVKVFGMLRVFLDGRVQLRVSKLGVDDLTGEERFQITRTEPVETSIRELIYNWGTPESLKYKGAILRGMITGMRPLAAAKIYALEDNEGHSISMYVHNGLRFVGDVELDLKLLQEISVTAGVSEFGGTPQLALASYSDLRVIGEITHENLMADMKNIAAIFENDVKESNNLFLKSTENMTSAFENVKGSFNQFLGDLRIVVSSYENDLRNLVRALENGSLSGVTDLLGRIKNIGTFLDEMKGKIDEFLETAENHVSEATLDNLRALKNRFLESGAYVGEAESLLRGKFVRAGGRVIFVEMEGERGSLEIEKRRFWLNDEENPYVWMWEDAYELLRKSTRELLKRGSAAEFTGRISSYGELSIELVAPPELDFVENVHELPFVENVKELGSDNVGQFVAIEGEVIGSVEIPKAGVPGDWEFTLEDNFGGTIKVWISNIIYERLSDPPSDGDILRVSGRVIEDKGEIQVQPGVPADVEVRTWKP